MDGWLDVLIMILLNIVVVIGDILIKNVLMYYLLSARGAQKVSNFAFPTLKHFPLFIYGQDPFF